MNKPPWKDSLQLALLAKDRVFRARIDDAWKLPMPRRGDDRLVALYELVKERANNETCNRLLAELKYLRCVPIKEQKT